ncbi:MAG: Gfo/Idh/MocA family protein, partial [Alphaproteobacteria bacterium]
MTVHKVGIIGLGGMGRMMLADMARHSGFSAVAAWDPDQKTCDAVLGDNPSISIPASADALINRLDIDLVYIASPPKTHKLYFEHAIAAGIPVYCEKPFGVDLPESQDLVRRIEQANLPNIINFNHGNALGSTHIDQQIRAGAMGDVVNVDILIHLTEWPRAFQKTATWLAKRDQGGFTREMLSHWLY